MLTNYTISPKLHGPADVGQGFQKIIYHFLVAGGRQHLGPDWHPGLGHVLPAHMHKLQSEILVPDVTSIILNKIVKLRTCAEILPQETCLAENGTVSQAKQTSQGASASLRRGHRDATRSHGLEIIPVHRSGNVPASMLLEAPSSERQ